MSKTKIVLISIGLFLALIIFAGVMGFIDIGFQKVFRPMQENVNREVFENTKSYVYGAVQDIAKYYEEYQKAETYEVKETIANVIKSRFSNFDSKKIKNDSLRIFFENVRGY